MYLSNSLRIIMNTLDVLSILNTCSWNFFFLILWEKTLHTYMLHFSVGSLYIFSTYSLTWGRTTTKKELKRWIEVVKIKFSFSIDSAAGNTSICWFSITVSKCHKCSVNVNCLPHQKIPGSKHVISGFLHIFQPYLALLWLLH